MARVIRLRRVMELEIRLVGPMPPIRRWVAVDAEVGLSHLHRAVQAAMGWHDLHAHAFRGDGGVFGVPDPCHEDPWPHMQDQSGTGVREILARTGDHAEYVYDFRDRWLHWLTVTRLRPAAPEEWLPTCLGGARSCPPESCGGAAGYRALVRALADPHAPDHRRHHQWLGGFFFPELFDVAEANERLARAFAD